MPKWNFIKNNYWVISINDGDQQKNFCTKKYYNTTWERKYIVRERERGEKKFSDQLLRKKCFVVVKIKLIKKITKNSKLFSTYLQKLTITNKMVYTFK